MKITTQDINEAAHRLTAVVRKTPLQLSQRLSKKYHATVYLKREDLQEVRSFKIRGAYNKIITLTKEEQQRGVVTASAGNHAQGVALSCAQLRIKGVIFMPTVTPNQKIARVRHFGGTYTQVQLVGTTYDEASQAAKDYAEVNHLVFIPPFDDPAVIAGQGTIAKEVMEQLDASVDYVVAPVGGGGLISGLGVYCKGVNSKINIIGAEPDGATSMQASLAQHKIVTLKSIDTFVDGVAVKTPGKLTFDLCSQLLEKIVVVETGKVCSVMIELYQNEGIITEPAGALAVAALDTIASEIKGKTVVCIISGGNNDILRYPEIMEKSLIYQGRKHYFLIEFAQKPGQLRAFLNKALGPRDDIVLFEYIKKTNRENGPALIGIELANRKDYQPLVTRMNKLGLIYTILKPSDLLYRFLI